MYKIAIGFSDKTPV